MGRSEARIAENGVVFREVNERMAAWEERQEAPTERQAFFCECGESGCFERVALTGPQYEAVRAEAARFAVAPGHEMPEAERVVEQCDGYIVVQKNEDVRPVAERADPRR